MAQDTATPMETAANAQEIILGVWGQIQGFGFDLLRPWNAYQMFIVIGLAIVAHILMKVLGPRIYDWMRAREGWPKWRMRFLVLLHRRLRIVFFVAMIWPLVWVMQEVTWPSRSYLLVFVAQLALAWLVIAIVTRLIANGFARSMARYVAWTWVTLAILGLTDEAQSLLDSAAIEAGEMHLSLWLILQAVVVIVALTTAARFVSTTTAARIRRNAEISPSMQVLAIKFLQVMLYGAAFFIGLKAVGVDLTGLAVLSGAIGVGLGFGLQKVVSNLVSGIIILLDKSIKPGDVISLGDTFGWINSLGARYVSITNAGRSRIPDPQRGPDHRAGGQLVSFKRFCPARRLFRHCLSQRPARGAPHRHSGGAAGRKGSQHQTAGVPYRGLRRQLGRLYPAVLDIRPHRRADQYPRQCLPGALGCVPRQRHLDPVPAARGAHAVAMTQTKEPRRPNHRSQKPEYRRPWRKIATPKIV